MNVTFTFHFLQRQYFLEPFNENKMMKNWLISEMLLYLLYFLVVGTPIILYVISVFFLTMKRELSIALSMVMVLMIHPIFSLLFGLSIKSLSQLIWPRKGKGDKTVWERLFTFSINVYLSMIGVVIFYLMSMDVSLGKEYQYKDQSYFKCLCDELKERNNDQCTNEENDDVQNKFVGFPIKNFVLSFSIVSLACHVIHSLVVAIPSPIRMIDFILGSEKTNDTKGQETAELMEMTSPDKRLSTHEPKGKDSMCKRGWTICFKVICFILTLAVVGCLGAMPYIHFSFGKSSSTNSGCPTQSSDKCTFPFVFQNVTYYGCSKVDNEVIGFHGEGNHSAKAWCAIDAKENGQGAKRYEICKDNCPGGTKNHI